MFIGIHEIFIVGYGDQLFCPDDVIFHRIDWLFGSRTIDGFMLRSACFGRVLLITVPLAMVATIIAPLSQAQGYPNHPVRWVIPFSAGGAGDIPGRIVSQKLSEALGQQIVIDNRAGAGSTMGAEQVAKAQPDGYTFLMISMTHFVSAALYSRLQYDPLNDFTPVTQMTSGPNVLLAHPSLPVKSVGELLALARSMPGKLNYASSGNGSFPHLNFALFLSMTGVQMTHIPYRGSGPALADLLGGKCR